MFRPIVRKKQALPEEECREILRQEPRGVLSVQGDDGYPYAIPINHWYNDEDGRLYFHGASSGHKIEALRKNDKACYCVYDQGFRREGEWALNIRSVVVFGRVRFIEDHEQALEISRRLSRKFTDDEAYIEHEVTRAGARVLCFELIPEYMTGKIVNES